MLSRNAAARIVRSVDHRLPPMAGAALRVLESLVMRMGEDRAVAALDDAFTTNTDPIPALLAALPRMERRAFRAAQKAHRAAQRAERAALAQQMADIPPPRLRPRRRAEPAQPAALDTAA